LLFHRPPYGKKSNPMMIQRTNVAMVDLSILLRPLDLMTPTSTANNLFIISIRVFYPLTTAFFMVVVADFWMAIDFATYDFTHNILILL
jgi:hypothetical protein